MNEAGIKGAISGALHFITHAREALKDRTDIDEDGAMQIGRGKKSSACRRASMDLTRALAEMRKP